MSDTEAPEVGIVGLGLLGFPIAVQLINAGFTVTGCDTNEERARLASSVGVRVVPTPRAVGDAAATVLTVLASIEALAAVCGGSDGLAASAQCATVVEVSTLPVRSKQAAARLLGQRQTMVDCPVIGSSAQAARGELVVYASGDDAALASVVGVLEAFTQRTEYLGAFGNGTKMKLVSNLLVAVHAAAAAEAMLLASRAGIDRAKALRALVGTGAGSRVLELRGDMLVRGVFEPATMKTSVFYKDVGLIMELADSVKSPVPMHRQAAELYVHAIEQGLGDLDNSSIFLVLSTISQNIPETNDEPEPPKRTS